MTMGALVVEVPEAKSAMPDMSGAMGGMMGGDKGAQVGMLGATPFSNHPALGGNGAATGAGLCP